MRVHTEYSTSSSASDNDHLAAPRQGSKVSLARTVGHISDFPVKKKTTQAFCCRIQTRDGWTRKKKRRRHHNWYDTRHSACSRLVGVKPSINFNLKTIDARNLQNKPHEDWACLLLLIETFAAVIQHRWDFGGSFEMNFVHTGMISSQGCEPKTESRFFGRFFSVFPDRKPTF